MLRIVMEKLFGRVTSLSDSKRHQQAKDDEVKARQKDAAQEREELRKITEQLNHTREQLNQVMAQRHYRREP